MERIQKRISASGVTSRRKAEELIKEGRVKVNGVVIDTPGYKVSPKDEVTLDDVLLERNTKVYYAINKPRGIISAVSDDRGRKTIIDILPNEIKEEHVFPVGRLDYDTKGVLLLTNDGDFMNLMVGPKSALQKEYLVRVKGILTKEQVDRLETGVSIKGRKTLPAIVIVESIDRNNNSCLLRITITEGMYHQIKEMIKAVDGEVKKLTRVRFGNVLIESMSEGEVRKLSTHEIKELYALSKQNKILKKEPINNYRQY